MNLFNQNDHLKELRYAQFLFRISKVNTLLNKIWKLKEKISEKTKDFSFLIQISGFIG